MDTLNGNGGDDVHSHSHFQETRDRTRGAIAGMACGDAVGTAVEFQEPGSFEPLRDMVGGGVFHLQPGAWTDDTSMGLCIAESLIERRGKNDLADQLDRYCDWYENGHLSSNGTCFDIGMAIRSALGRYMKSRDPKGMAGATGDRASGNGSIMRLAAVPALYSRCQPARVALECGESSKTTHGSEIAIDCAMAMGLIIQACINRRSPSTSTSTSTSSEKDNVLSPKLFDIAGLWGGPVAADGRISISRCMRPVVQSVVVGQSYLAKDPPAIKGTGYCVDCLEAALWAFSKTDDFESGCLLVANLGNDADTSAAVYGQIAGAFYGFNDELARMRESLQFDDGGDGGDGGDGTWEWSAEYKALRSDLLAAEASYAVVKRCLLPGPRQYRSREAFDAGYDVIRRSSQRGGVWSDFARRYEFDWESVSKYM